MSTAKTAPDKKPRAEAKAGAVRIIARKDGLRRAGVVHAGDVTHPAGAFTLEQIEALRAEPLLTVIEEDEPAAA